MINILSTICTTISQNLKAITISKWNHTFLCFFVCLFFVRLYLMSVKCNHNLILHVLGLGHFHILYHCGKKKKSLRKNNHLMWSLLEQKTLQKNIYWSEHTEMKMTWYTNGIFVNSYIFKEIIQVQTQGELDAWKQLTKY